MWSYGKCGLEKFSNIQFSHSVTSDSCEPMDCSTPGFLSIISSWSLLKFMAFESVMPSNRLILCHPFYSCLQSFPASGSFPMSQFLASGGQNIGASASASVLPMNIQGWFPVGLTGLICCLRDSQKSSPTPQFENTSSLELSLLYGPTLTSVYDYWKNHGFD